VRYPLNMSKRRIRVQGSLSRVRGRLVETIVSAMHHAPGVQVRQNVLLPPITGTGRRREIDVLIEGTVSGYPIRIPIECKNEKQVAGAEDLDAFVGKLQYVGLSPQQAVFVSVKGYTKGAIARAKAAGIRTLILTGLTPDRLHSVIFEAMHATVCLLPVVTEVEVTNAVSIPTDAVIEDLGFYRDEHGAIIGSIPDLAWRAWIVNQVPNSLGEHRVQLHLPKGWRNIVHGRDSVPERLVVNFTIYGFALVEKGTAERHALLDVELEVMVRLQLKTNIPILDPTTSRAIVFSSEDRLQAFLTAEGAHVQMTTRMRLPRIMWNGAFWPFSVRVANALDEIYRQGKSHGPEVLVEVEEPRLANVWEPMCFTPWLKGILEAEFE